MSKHNLTCMTGQHIWIFRWSKHKIKKLRWSLGYFVYFFLIDKKNKKNIKINFYNIFYWMKMNYFKSLYEQFYKIQLV